MLKGKGVQAHVFRQSQLFRGPGADPNLGPQRAKALSSALSYPPEPCHQNPTLMDGVWEVFHSQLKRSFGSRNSVGDSQFFLKQDVVNGKTKRRGLFLDIRAHLAGEDSLRGGEMIQKCVQ